MDWGVIQTGFARAPVSIIGVDPGTDTMGTAILTFDPVSFEILRTEARTFQAARQMPEHWMHEHVGARQARLRFLHDVLVELFYSVQPLVVVGESNFISLRRPMAYGALVEIVSVIRDALYHWNPAKVLYLIEPNIAKAAVGVSSKSFSKKEAVLDAVLQLPLNYQGLIPLESVDSHSSDAIAIAYAKYCELRQAAFAERALRAQYGYPI